MATPFTIGGRVIDVPVMNLKSIRVWGRNVKALAAMATADPADMDPELVDDAIGATLEVVSAALEGTPNAMSAEAMNLAVRGMPEVQGLSVSLRALLVESGLESGEAAPAGGNAEPPLGTPPTP